MLSVVIPTYNEEEFLPSLLASLARQSVRDLEIIVADAHSTDRTREIAKKYGCTIVDGGLPAVGRNKGAAVARGELLLFLDADVILPGQDFLARVLQEFTDRSLDISTSLIRPMSSSSLDSFFYLFYNSYVYATQKFLPHAHGFFIIVRKELHNRIGGFDVRVQLAEDHDYAQRAAKAGAVFGLLMNEKLPVSTRRFLRDGHFRTAAKYVLCELHMLTLGSVKSDIFRYRFGYNKGLARKRP